MALSESKLASELEFWMSEQRDIETSAQIFADAYNTYALDAQDVTGDYPDTVYPDRTRDYLINNWTLGHGYYESAVVFEDAIQLYWQDGTFQLNNPPSGSTEETSADVTTIPPDDSIAVDLADVMESVISPDQTIPEIAAEWATPIHNGTIQTVVTCVGDKTTEQGPIS